MGERPSASTVLGLLVAGGRGERFGGREPKQFARLGDRPLVAHAAAVLDAAPELDGWIAVAPPGLEERTRQVLEAAGVARRLRAVVTGGDTRQRSVWNGLEAARDAGAILVQDAARPFVTARLVQASVEAAVRTGAATVALPVSDTLLRVETSDVVSSTPAGDAGVVVTGSIVDRDRLWQVQTPQAFTGSVLRAAHTAARARAESRARAATDDSGARAATDDSGARAATEDHRARAATDDSGLVLATGGKVALVPGAWWNIKVTTAEDLHHAELLLRVLSDART